MSKSRVASGRRFGLGLCAIALVLACQVDKRTYGDLVDTGTDAGARPDATAKPDTGADAALPPDASPGVTSAEAGSVPSIVPDASSDAEADTGPVPSQTTPITDAGHAPDASDGASDASTSNDAGADAAPLPDACGNTDPDCVCVDGTLAARDEDNDAHPTQACEAVPGDDCDDADDAFVSNACGGCSKDLPGLPGDACLDCGVLSCTGPDELTCVDPEPLPRRCVAYQPEVCSEGVWTTAGTCSSATQYCDEGTGQCASLLSSSVLSSSVLSSSVLSSSYSVSSSSSVSSVYSSSTAYLQEGASSPRKLRSVGCTYGLFHPRDDSFEVGSPSPRPASSSGIPTGNVLDRATGFDFG